MTPVTFDGCSMRLWRFKIDPSGWNRWVWVTVQRLWSWKPESHTGRTDGEIPGTEASTDVEDRMWSQWEEKNKKQINNSNNVTKTSYSVPKHTVTKKWGWKTPHNNRRDRKYLKCNLPWINRGSCERMTGLLNKQLSVIRTLHFKWSEHSNRIHFQY